MNNNTSTISGNPRQTNSHLHEPQRNETRPCSPQELGIVNAQYEVDKSFTFGPAYLTEELRSNVRNFLDQERWNGVSLREVIKQIMAATRLASPLLVGDDALRLIGMDFLLQQYKSLLRQVRADLSPEDCLSQECLYFARRACQKRVSSLTVRFCPTKAVELDTLHRALIERLGAKSVSGILDFKKDNTSFSSFYCESKVDGVNERIYFTFPTSLNTPFAASGDALQICIQPEGLMEYGVGNQWCVDTMHQRVRVLQRGKNLSKTIFRYVRNGYEVTEHERNILKQEILLPVDFLRKLSTDSDSSPERTLQNTLLMVQLTKDVAFLDEADLPEVPDSVWYQALCLLKQKQATYEEVECVMYLFGMLLARFQGDQYLEAVHSTTKKGIVFCNNTPGAECAFIVRKPHISLDSFDRFIPLIEAILRKPGFRRTEALSHQPSTSSYLAQLITCHTQGFEACLKTFPEELAGKSNAYKHVVGKVMKLVLQTRGLDIPELLHNGGILSDSLALGWAEALLAMGYSTTGVDLLAQSEGHHEVKCKWIKHFLAHQNFGLANRLIRQVAEVVGEDQVRSWLQSTASTNNHALLVDSLMQTKWVHVAYMSNPGLTHNIERLFNALHVEGPHQHEFVNLLAFQALSPAGAYEWADRMLQAVEDGTCTLSKNTRKRLRQERANFVANATSQELAVRYLRQFVVEYSDDDARMVVGCLEGTSNLALCRWYLELPLPPTFEPERRLALYSQMVSRFPELSSYSSHAAALKEHIEPDHIKALRAFLSASQLTKEDKEKLLKILETSSVPLDLVESYLQLPETVLPFKFEPARRVRLFLHLLAMHPSLLNKRWQEHLKALKLRIHEELPEVQAARALSKDAKTFDILFSIFYPKVRKEAPKAPAAKVVAKKADPASIIEELLANNDRKNQVASLLVKHKLSARLWKRAFTVFTNDLVHDVKIPHAIRLLIANTNELPNETVVEVWAMIFADARWHTTLKEEELFCGIKALKDETHEKRVSLVLEVLLPLVAKYPKHLSQAYTFYSRIAENHPRKVAFGISLIEQLKETDSAERLTQAAEIVQLLVKKDALSEAIVPFARASRTHDAVTRNAVLAVIRSSATSKRNTAMEFILKQFWDHPAIDVLEELYALARELQLRTKNVQATIHRDLCLRLLKESQSLETLLCLFEDEALQATQEHVPAYSLLQKLALTCTNPSQIERTLRLMLRLQKQNKTTFSTQIMLLQIQHVGWTEESKELFDEFLSLYNVEGDKAAQSYSILPCKGHTFSNAEEVTSICPLMIDPRGKWPFTDDVMVFIQTAIEMAKGATHEPSARRLLDVAIQSFRNLLDNGLVDAAIAERLRPLFDHFMRTQEEKQILSSLQKKIYRITGFAQTKQDFESEDLVSLQVIKERLGVAEDETTLLELQSMLLVWQEKELKTAYKEHHDCLVEICNVYRKHPSLLGDVPLQRSLIALLAPNTMPFTLKRGLEAKTWIVRAAELYINFYFEMYQERVKASPNGGYSSTVTMKGRERTELLKYTPNGQIARHCLDAMVRCLCHLSRVGVLDKEFTLVTESARKIMSLYRYRCFISIDDQRALLGPFTEIIVEKGRPDRLELAYEWLQVIAQYKSEVSYEKTFNQTLHNLIDSCVHLEFTNPELEAFLDCLTTPFVRKVVDGHRTHLKSHKEPLTIIQIRQIFNVLNTIYSSHRTAGRKVGEEQRQIAKSCLDAMILACNYANTNKLYDDQEHVYIEHSHILLSHVRSPSLFGIPLLVSAVQPFMNRLSDVFQCMLTYKDDSHYAMMLNVLLPKVIDKKLNAHERAFFEQLLADWKVLSPKEAGAHIANAALKSVEDNLAMLEIDNDGDK